MLFALTDQTQKIVTEDACRIAVRLKHKSINTEHILLALIENMDNTAVTAMRNCQLDINRLVNEIQYLIKQSVPVEMDYEPTQTRFSRQGLKVIECAREEAHSIGHSYVGTEHILLGLIREGEGIAYRVLSKGGMTLNRMRKEIWQVLNSKHTEQLSGKARDIKTSISGESAARIKDVETLMIHPDVREIIINKQQLGKRVHDLGKLISRDYAGKEPLLISVLKGSIIFLADLLRAISIPCRFDLMTVSSYVDKTESTGNVKLVMDLKQEVQGQDIIIVEDIFDTGQTLHYILEHIQIREPASIKVCVLLNKKRKHEIEIPLDYVGFDIPDEFVIGYGLDYMEKYRHLPYIGVLKPEIYQSNQSSN